jgi:hypothetical protein
MGETVIQNCTFQGPIWEGEQLEALLWVAKGLCNLTEIFRGEGMEAMLVIKPHEVHYHPKEDDAAVE